jgi:hypothetical protein
MEPEGLFSRSQGQSLVPNLSQMNPVHILPTYLSKIHSNIIFPSTPKSSEWSPPFMFYNQHILRISHLSHACYMSRPSHTLPFDHPNYIWWRVQVMKLLIM